MAATVISGLSILDTCLIVALLMADFNQLWKFQKQSSELLEGRKSFGTPCQY